MWAACSADPPRDRRETGSTPRSAAPRETRSRTPAPRAEIERHRSVQRGAHQALEQDAAEAAPVGRLPGGPPRSLPADAHLAVRASSRRRARPGRQRARRTCWRWWRARGRRGRGSARYRAPASAPGPRMRTCSPVGAIVWREAGADSSPRSAPCQDCDTSRSWAAAIARSASEKSVTKLVDVVRQARGLARHRLDDREQVLRAVGQLAHHQPHALLVAAPLGQVERGADDPVDACRPRRHAPRARRSKKRSTPAISSSSSTLSRPPLASTRCLAGTSLRRSCSGKMSASVRPRKSSGCGARAAGCRCRCSAGRRPARRR